jgi:putative holliday junction resolvase
MYLCLDVGKKKIGLATSNGYLAKPYKTIFYQSFDYLFKEIEKNIINLNIKIIIVGYPLKLNNEVSEMSLFVENFKSLLKKFIYKKLKNEKIEIILNNEKLSSKEAEKILISKKIHWSNKKRKIKEDNFASAVILQNYLDKINWKKEK